MDPKKPISTRSKSRATASRPQSRRSSRTVARTAAKGDIAPQLTTDGIERFSVSEAVDAAHESKAFAVGDIIKRALQESPAAASESLEAILDGASPDDVDALRRLLFRRGDEARALRRATEDSELAEGWRDGGYPYRNLMSRKSYEQHKYRLQVELLKLQAWVKETGARVVILFEGRLSLIHI